jgi:hypothetical protein
MASRRRQRPGGIAAVQRKCWQCLLHRADVREHARLALCAAVRDDDWTYRHYLPAAKRVQGSTTGLLTDIIEAMRQGKEENVTKCQQMSRF